MGTNAVDITSTITKDGSYALNASEKYPWTNILNPDERFQLRSDDDEQLILHLTFSQAVNLSGINIVAPTDGEMQPTSVKLFANRLNLGFDDVDSYPANEELELTDADLAEDVVAPLKIIKFRSVVSLTIFVAENAGADVSAISSIKLYGQSIQGTNVEDIQDAEKATKLGGAPPPAK